MARYANGRVPESVLVHDEYGNPWLPGTYAKFVRMRDIVQAQTGVRLTVTPPAHGAHNTYRSLSEQGSVRSVLGVMAAIPGNSSHGGVWNGSTNGNYGLPRSVYGMETGAFDVYNWMAVPWGVFKSAADAVGLMVDVIVPKELWHVVDPTPFDVPTKAPATANEPAADAAEIGDDDVEAYILTAPDSAAYGKGQVLYVRPGRKKTFSSADDYRDWVTTINGLRDAKQTSMMRPPALTELQPLPDWAVGAILTNYGLT